MKSTEEKLGLARLELERELKRRDLEYLNLTRQAAYLAAATLAVQLTFTSPHETRVWKANIWIPTVCLSGFILIYIFIKRAQQSPIGVKGYLDIEKRLLISEIPNIFQIVSMLSILNLLLKQYYVRLIGTMVVTFLLTIYLTGKRRDIVLREPRYIRTNVTDRVTALLSLIIGIIFGLTVYGIASLISIQIT